MADRTFYRRDCSRLDYTFNWNDELSQYSDTISSYTLTVLSGDLVIDADSESANVITYWVTGTSGEIECEMTSAGGRTDCRVAEFIAI